MIMPNRKNQVQTLIGILDLDNIVSVSYFPETNLTVVQGKGENNYFTSMGITLCNQLIEALKIYGKNNENNQDKNGEGPNPPQTRIQNTQN